MFLATVSPSPSIVLNGGIRVLLSSSMNIIRDFPSNVNFLEDMAQYENKYIRKENNINNKNESERRYEDAEIGIMDIYENGVKIKGYKIKKNNVNSYNANNPLVNKTIILLNN